jgi:molybdopterin-synthase adenylyltransferase
MQFSTVLMMFNKVPHPVNTPSLPPLNTEQALRYSRQIMLSGFDLDKQERLLASRVLMIGVGGLGCAAAQYLVAAGLGVLTLVDDDKVERSNLQRQILHNEQRIGEFKTLSAKTSLQGLNSQTQLHTIEYRLNDEQLSEQLQLHDLVLDCSDNLATRQQLNRLCQRAKLPLVSGAAIRMEAQIYCFIPGPENACYQCLSDHLGEQQLSCMEAGVMAPLVGIIGAMQALESIKILCNFGQSIHNRLVMFDALEGQWHSFALVKDPHCAVCGV